jgi:hypothetical protein
MIVGTQKPFPELWEMVQGFKKVLVLGCNTCVAICHAGGGKEAEIIATMLRMKAAEEGVALEAAHDAVQRQCEPEYFEPILEQARGYDLVLSTACGVGVNFLTQRIGKVPVYPGVNTRSTGRCRRRGLRRAVCRCGNCILHLTGGICPIARCSKSLMNGPCGGTDKGKCEVSKDIDCAWYLIVERMKELGTLDKLSEIQEPRNWSTSRDGGPRRVVAEHIADLEEAEAKK